jgi:hypothetical protein
MTVSSTNLFNNAVGDGVTLGPFSFTFACQIATQLIVSINGVVQSPSTYNVTLNVNAKGTTPAGGSVTFNTAPPNLAVILFTRLIAFTQLVSFPIQAAFVMSVLENSLDAVVMALQGQAVLASLAISLPVGTTGVSTVLPNPVGNNCIGWDPTGTFVTNIPFTTILAGVTGVGLGNVIGPGSTTAGNMALFNNTTGTLLKQGVAAPSATQYLGGDGSGNFLSKVFPGILMTPLRLYLVTGQPEADGSSSGNNAIFVGPYKGNQIVVSDTTGNLTFLTLAEKTLSVSGLSSGTAYSVYLVNTGGVLTVSTVADWTNLTTPPTYGTDALGRRCKTGAGNVNQLLVGDIYCSSSGLTNDWTGERSVSNELIPIPKAVFAQDTTPNWTYNVQTFRAANANTTNGQGRVTVFSGKPNSPISLNIFGTVSGSAGAYIGIGINTTSASSVATSGASVSGGGAGTLAASYAGTATVGLNYYQRLEAAQAGFTLNFGYSGTLLVGTGGNGLNGLVFQ